MLERGVRAAEKPHTHTHSLFLLSETSLESHQFKVRVINFP